MAGGELNHDLLLVVSAEALPDQLQGLVVGEDNRLFGDIGSVFVERKLNEVRENRVLVERGLVVFVSLLNNQLHDVVRELLLRELSAMLYDLINHLGNLGKGRFKAWW